MTRAMIAALLALFLVACGGSSKHAAAPTLPPANPKAVSKMARASLATVRFIRSISRAPSLSFDPGSLFPRLNKARILAVSSGNANGLTR